jgi:hypothetical protein
MGVQVRGDSVIVLVANNVVIRTIFNKINMIEKLPFYDISLTDIS